MERAILHCDLNNFYASVETVVSPELRGKAIAICGRTEDRHGIVLAKSEAAKQATLYGRQRANVPIFWFFLLDFPNISNIHVR